MYVMPSSSLYGSSGSILDRALTIQRAASDSSLSSCNILFKASVIRLSFSTIRKRPSLPLKIYLTTCK